MTLLRALTVLAFFAQALSAAHAEAVILVDKAGVETEIGTVTFIPGAKPGEQSFRVDLSSGPFSEEFLSMRPFRCLRTETEWFCHLPYPYSLRGTVGADDLTDLEYSLLFLRKAPAEFGIDAWNGLYFKLARQPDGSIAGTLMEGDLGVLAAPPDDPFARPIDLDGFVEADLSRRAFSRLIIR